MAIYSEHFTFGANFKSSPVVNDPWKVGRLEDWLLTL